jgi:hypothetical protein
MAKGGGSEWYNAFTFSKPVSSTTTISSDDFEKAKASLQYWTQTELSKPVQVGSQTAEVPYSAVADTSTFGLFYDPATGGVMQGQSSFQQSATSPTQASQLESRLTAIILELEELESSMQEIAKLVEAGLESYTLMRRHISNLRRDANPLGTMPPAPKKKPQRYSLSPGQVHFANQPAGPPIAPLAEAGGEPTELAPSPPDQE